MNPDGSTFREVWTPLPDSEGACGSWRAGTAQIVRVGRHVVHVDDDCGSYFELPADVTGLRLLDDVGCGGQPLLDGRRHARTGR